VRSKEDPQQLKVGWRLKMGLISFLRNFYQIKRNLWKDQRMNLILEWIKICTQLSRVRDLKNSKWIEIQMTLTWIMEKT